MIYDVAISFIWADVAAARSLYEILRDRLDVFFSDEEPAAITGTDGEETFGRIFRDDSRIVVVFYRKEWGTTMFTRAEQAAIKQRAVKEGYGFCIFVPLDKERHVPPYLPQQYIWLDFDRYGVEGLAACVEERVRESGLEVRPTTTIEKLMQLDRSIALAESREEFERSPAGREMIAEVDSRLVTIVATRIEEYNEASSKIRFTFEEKHDVVIIRAWPFRCHMRVYGRSNWIVDTRLVANIEKNHGERPYDDEWKLAARFELKPTLDDGGKPAWQYDGNSYRSLDAAVESILDNVAERLAAHVTRDRKL